MNELDYIRFQFDPEIGKLFYVPDSGRLAGMCQSKQRMYNDRFKNDTNVFFGFDHDDDGKTVYAKVYGRKVDDSIRVRDRRIWISFAGLCSLPEGLLDEMKFQFDDPDYLIRRIRAEIYNKELQRQIEEAAKENKTETVPTISGRKREMEMILKGLTEQLEKVEEEKGHGNIQV